MTVAAKPATQRLRITLRGAVQGVGTAVTLILLSLFASCYLHDSLLEQRFERVTQGMEQQQVRSVLGKPDSVGPCGKLGGVPDGCVLEYLYYAKLPTITTWAVFFNEHGTVLDTYRYQSP
jgi:hypothetical protein